MGKRLRGSGIPDNVLKIGTASGSGNCTFTIADSFDEISKVSITGYGWKNTTKVAVNGSATQSPSAAATEVTFDYVLSEPTRTIAINITTSAFCATEIVLYKEATSSVYTVTYDCNGGESNCPSNLTDIEPGTSITLASAPTKPHYNFIGWKNGGTTYDAGASYTVNSNVTFIAQWEPDGTYGEGSICFSNQSSCTAINSQSVTGEDNLGNTWTITTVGTNSFTSNSGYYQVGSGTSPATSITFTTTLDEEVNVTNFSATFGGFNATRASVVLIVDNTQVGSGTLNGGSDVTVSSSSAQIGTTLTVIVTPTAGGVKCYNISYAYETIDNPAVATPTFYPETGAVAAGTTITISTTTTGATIYYTTDGTEPSFTNGTQGASVTINEACTLKAIAIKEGCVNSDIASADYTILAPAATPTFSPVAGTYTWAQNVTISTTTEGATIYYTTNGDNPTTSSTEYTAAIEVNETMTIKAIAAKDGMANSDVVEATYTMNIPAINASNVNLTYDAIAGSIDYTMTNPVDGGALTAAITGGNEGSWLTLGAVSDEAVALTCSANDGNADRDATVTLTYTYNTDKTVTKVVTITQAHFVVDYAILPFVWAGGAKTDFLALTGVSASGLGSDYAVDNSPYLIKLDGTGDYIQVKTDSQPAKVTIGVKMIGGANTSTITVQGSADGETFTDVEELTISGAQYDELTLETSNAFAANVRYVRMLFTKGSNVGVGPITITKYTTDPIINAEDVNIACDATNGSIAYSISNPVEGGALTAVITAGNEGNWLTLGSVTTSVAFTCTANTTDVDRTATVTLTYTYNTSETVTKDVTVTQSKVDYATMPFAYDGGKNDFPTGLTGTLGKDYSDSPKLGFRNTDDNLILKLNEAPVSISYDIKGNSFSGGTFKVQVSANGSEYTDVETYTSLGDTQTITLLNSVDNVRYIKWVYTEKVNGNVALGNIKVTTDMIINGDCTVNDFTISNTDVLTIESGSVMTVTGTLTNNGDETNLIIEDGGQLICNNPVNATLQKGIEAAVVWGVPGADAWYFIASPVDGYETGNVIITGTTDTDLYSFDEESGYWFNGQGSAHHFTTLTRGQGYLYANSTGDDLSFIGTMPATNTNIEKTLSYAGNGDLKGFNLMGNPFTCNLTNDNVKIQYGETQTSLTTYYIVENGTELAPKDFSTNPIKPGRGFLIQADKDGQKLVFNPGAKRGETINKPSFIRIEAGNADFMDRAYVQFGQGNTLRKMTINDNVSHVYVMSEGKDYAAATIQEARGEMPVNFKAHRNGQYTITVNPQEVEMDYLHLIDNIAGVDVDLLANPSYSFNAKADDYASRFRLVFSANSENESGNENDNFAFISDGELIINGTGTLQVFDVLGRNVFSKEDLTLNAHLSTLTFKAGVYVLRLINGTDVKTQKIVVK